LKYPHRDAESDDDLIPVAEVARHRGTTVRAVLELAKRDPDHPPLIGLSPSPRAPKFLRRGPTRDYEALRERQAADRKRQRLAAKGEPLRKEALPLTGSVAGKPVNPSH
jgi:hypothetical protein